MTSSNRKNPFADARTKEERDQVWQTLRAKSKRLTKEEAERLLQDAIRLRNSGK